MSTEATTHPASYRDPAGYIFESNGVLYRQVNKLYQGNFEHLISSGCYRYMVEHGLLIPHENISENLTGDPQHFQTLRPHQLPFISYPYEWCFEMLKDAALLTLQILREALQFGMILKDATPYNIQWYNGRLVLIDILSFEKYEERPWIAYRQFCESFLAPLLLMHYRKLPLQSLQLAWPDGIPLNVASKLLPRKTRFSLHTYLHIHLHASVSSRKTKAPGEIPRFPRNKLLNLLSSLETLITRLRFADADSTWSNYYEEASTRKDYLSEKKQIISTWCSQLENINSAADLGANEGEFSAILARNEIATIAADFDPYCINRLYRSIKTSGEKNILPLIIDLANPSPANGVNNEERSSFSSRVNVDLVLALALIHHLCIGKNIPFVKVSQFFSELAKYLIIEFVPKSDEKVQILLSNKTDIYPNYTEAKFLEAFMLHYDVEERKEISSSGRTMFLLKRK